MSKLVAFVGFAGSGKSTCAQFLDGWSQLAFADALKDCLAIIFGWDRAMLEGTTPESRIWRETRDSWWSARLGIIDFTPRYAMQHFGTGIMRKYFHPEIWVMCLENRLNRLTGNIIVTDCRFPNEADLILRRGGEIYEISPLIQPIWRDIGVLAAMGHHESKEEMVKLGIHESEWSWLGIETHGVIQNDGKNLSLLRSSVLKTLSIA